MEQRDAKEEMQLGRNKLARPKKAQLSSNLAARASFYIPGEQTSGTPPHRSFYLHSLDLAREAFSEPHRPLLSHIRIVSRILSDKRPEVDIDPTDGVLE